MKTEKVKLVYCDNKAAELSFNLPAEYSGAVSCDMVTCHYRHSSKNWERVKDETKFNAKDPKAVVVAYLQLEGSQDSYGIQMGKLIAIPSFEKAIDHVGDHWSFLPNAKLIITGGELEFTTN